MPGLTPEKYREQWESLNSLVNPKPPPEEIEKLLSKYQIQQPGRVMSRPAVKKLNQKLIQEINNLK